MKRTLVTSSLLVLLLAACDSDSTIQTLATENQNLRTQVEHLTMLNQEMQTQTDEISRVIDQLQTNVNRINAESGGVSGGSSD